MNPAVINQATPGGTRKTECATLDLTGAALDYAVALSLGLPVDLGKSSSEGVFVGEGNSQKFSPSSDPACGVPVMESEGIAVWRDGKVWRAAHPDEDVYTPGYYNAEVGSIDKCGGTDMAGPTILVAAMRVLVDTRIDGCVGIPDNLLTL